MYFYVYVAQATDGYSGHFGKDGKQYEHANPEDQEQKPSSINDSEQPAVNKPCKLKYSHCYFSVIHRCSYRIYS